MTTTAQNTTKSPANFLAFFNKANNNRGSKERSGEEEEEGFERNFKRVKNWKRVCLNNVVRAEEEFKEVEEEREVRVDSRIESRSWRAVKEVWIRSNAASKAGITGGCGIGVEGRVVAEVEVRWRRFEEVKGIGEGAMNPGG